MPKLPSIEGNELLKFLRKLNFEVTRRKGSHVRLKSTDGRVTTIPIHKGKILPKGLLRKIIREDLKMSLQEFVDLYNKFKN